MKLHSINHSYFKLDGGAMYGVVPKSLWNKLNPADENNLCNWALRSLVIEDEGRLILIRMVMLSRSKILVISETAKSDWRLYSAI